MRSRGRHFGRQWLAVLAGCAAIAVALALSLGGGGTSAREKARRQSHPHRVARHAGPSLQTLIARGDAWIRRTATLGLPIYCGGFRGRDVAFTFDDGPGPYTRLALKKLRQAHERATFFDVGISMNAHPGLLPAELKLAAIGDHTYNHPFLPGLAPSQVEYQLKRTARMIQARSGQRVDLFRPPYAAFNTAVQAIAKRLGLLDIIATIDSRDSLGANWKQIIKNVEAGLHPGSIILMHENHGQTIRALTTLLPVLHRRHLRSVSLPELFAVDPPSVAQIRRGLSGCWPGGRVVTPVGGA